MAETTRDRFGGRQDGNTAVASAYPGAYHRTCPTQQQARQNSTPEMRVAVAKFRGLIKATGKQLFAVLPAFADITLVASDGDVPAHRIILGGRSTVMKAWFLLREVRKKDDGVKDGNDRIILDGHSKEEVETFLELLYTGESPKFANHIRAMFLLSRKYQVEDVMKLAEAGLYSTLNADNAMDLFLLAAGEKDDALSKAVVQFIVKPANKKAVMAHDKYQALKTDHPEVYVSLLEQIIAV
ncbi:hypothetical protein BV898_16137 [Hypsibius exemplaris]|uniref:BTB domain-containing protein n=1 Tax=Hypsibius exemplaris TaxID=2072580 RepID=A0A9X6NCL2_HYPEX|nr:hypothetical protein BV898_16137 [Hypsibius exemplaris]